MTIRGKKIAMVMQDPMTSLDPLMPVGKQIKESIERNQGLKGAAAKKAAIEMLKKVGIPDAEKRYGQYPHEFSGGQRQRIGIARALAVDPDLIICDEPVSALDVSIQAQVINLLNDLRERLGLTILFIAHDLSVVKYFSDRIGVMYFGKMVELATSDELFAHPMHPYTIGIQKAKPSLASDAAAELYSIPGNVPNPINIPDECLFKGRCNRRCGKCEGAYPKEIKITETHSVFCHLYDEKGGEN